jgi:hypothetical protein
MVAAEQLLSNRDRAPQVGLGRFSIACAKSELAEHAKRLSEVSPPPRTRAFRKLKQLANNSLGLVEPLVEKQTLGLSVEATDPVVDFRGVIDRGVRAKARRYAATAKPCRAGIGAILWLNRATTMRLVIPGSRHDRTHLSPS